ncbi:hypothetical protein HNS38_08980 [Lentimicrobium sp. L6]|uniref:hypothetical protein n=1 Tax=Lentimicrobium sp. L6 TaxID=2735916 RepID=UPI00155396A6|nr:hypothetical protein [Lentimicrobium sp. L6]NPD84889.1 hypothetical protein [Lentimicrobium sp. L6]
MKRLLIIIIISLAVFFSSCSKERHHYLTEIDKEFLGLAVEDTNILLEYNYNLSEPDTSFNFIKADYREFESVKTEGFADIPYKEHLETITRYNSKGYIKIQKKKTNKLDVTINCYSFTFNDIIEQGVSVEIRGKVYHDVYIFSEKLWLLYYSKEFGYLKFEENRGGDVLFEILE